MSTSKPALLNGADAATSTSREGSSYGQILRATSIIGGVQVITLFVGLLRNKAAALLIGPAGVGLLGSFQQVQTLIAMLAGLGVHSSAVREIAAAVESKNVDRLARVAVALRRICWILGTIGGVVAVLARKSISTWTFGTPDYATGVVAIGVTVLLVCVSDGQLALVRGSRRLGDIALMTVGGALIGVAASVAIFWWKGSAGIPLMLIVGAASQLFMSFLLSRRIALVPVEESWGGSLATAKPLLWLGIAMMSVSAIEGVVALAARSIIIRDLGSEALGAFSAANSLSMVLVSFILTAMIADYFPRLAGSAHDPLRMTAIINEQVEVGLLLSAPGVLVVISLAPVLVTLLYSSAFTGAIGLLPWLAVGSLGRIVAWPLQAVMTALGRGRWHVTILFGMNGLLVLFVAAGVRIGGLSGVGVAFAAHGLLLNVVLRLVAGHLCGFRYLPATASLARRILPAVAAALVGASVLPTVGSVFWGLALTAITSVLCLRALILRVGPTHRISTIALRVPLVRRLVATDT